MVTVEPGVSARDPGRSGRLMRQYSNTKMLSGSLQVNIFKQNLTGSVAFIIETVIFKKLPIDGSGPLAGINLSYIVSNGDAIFVMLLAIVLNTYTVFSIIGLSLVYVGIVLLQKT